MEVTNVMLSDEELYGAAGELHLMLFAVEVNCTMSGGIGRQCETSAGVENTNMHRVFQSHLNDPAKAARIVNSFFPLADPEILNVSADEFHHA